MEQRNLFKRIFGGKSDKSQTRYEMLSSPSSTFYSWDGQTFDSDIVRSAIRPKANAVGKLTPKHLRGYEEDMRINPVPFLRELLQFPNPYMSMQDFLMKMTYQRELNHNAFAYIQRDESEYPIAIWPVPYTSVEMIDKRGEMWCHFSFWNGQTVSVPYEDVIHLRKDYHKHDVFGSDGQKAIQGLMEVINTTDQGVVAAIKNSAAIRWLLKFKSILKPEDEKAQIKKFTSNYLSISNHGGAAATDPRYDAEQVRHDGFVPNAAQMNSTIQRLYAYFGVNDNIVQNKYTEDEWNAFYESEVEPILIQLSNAFTKGLFSRTERGHGNRILFEASNLAYASMRTKLGLLSMVDRGAMTPNEWRRVLNLPPVEDGDKPIRRLDTVPVDDEQEEEQEEENDLEE